jgi:hypothetical protein
MRSTHFAIYGRITDRLYFVTTGDQAISVTPDFHVQVRSDADLLTVRGTPLSDLQDNPVPLAARRAAVAFAEQHGLAIDPHDAFHD